MPRRSTRRTLQIAYFMTLILLLTSPIIRGQSIEGFDAPRGVTEASPALIKVWSVDCPVIGASPLLEQLVRINIRVMEPDVLPRRIVFFSHLKYLHSTRVFQLRVPPGYTSTMFTHLPSATVFIDRDYCDDLDWFADRFAHELGHLKSGSPSEGEADRAARIYRERLRAFRAKSKTQKP